MFFRLYLDKISKVPNPKTKKSEIQLNREAANRHLTCVGVFSMIGG